MSNKDVSAAQSAQGEKEKREKWEKEMETDPKWVKVFVPKEYIERIRNIFSTETDSEAVSLALFYFFIGESIGNDINKAYNRISEEKKKGREEYENALEKYKDAKEKAAEFLSRNADMSTEEAYFIEEYFL